MLLGLDPVLNAEALYVLRAMGHGDEIVICDTNFPADSVARETLHGELVRMDNVTAARAVRAILSVMPLDSFVDSPALRMEVVGQPTELPDVQREVQEEIDRMGAAHFGNPNLKMGSIERHAFYAQAKKAYAVVVTGERRFYGCFILKKGVIPPEA